MGGATRDNGSLHSPRLPRVHPLPQDPNFHAPLLNPFPPSLPPFILCWVTWSSSASQMPLKITLRLRASQMARESSGGLMSQSPSLRCGTSNAGQEKARGGEREQGGQAGGAGSQHRAPKVWVACTGRLQSPASAFWFIPLNPSTPHSQLFHSLIHPLHDGTCLSSSLLPTLSSSLSLTV